MTSEPLAAMEAARRPPYVRDDVHSMRIDMN